MVVTLTPAQQGLVALSTLGIPGCRSFVASFPNSPEAAGRIYGHKKGMQPEHSEVKEGCRSCSGEAIRAPAMIFVTAGLQCMLSVPCKLFDLWALQKKLVPFIPII